MIKFQEITLNSPCIEDIDKFNSQLLQDNLFCFYIPDEEKPVITDISIRDDLIGRAVDYSIVKDENSTHIEWKIELAIISYGTFYSRRGCNFVLAAYNCGVHLHIQPIIQQDECFLIIKNGKINF